MKKVLFSIIIVSLFFLALETGQRVRYAIRYKHSYWLGYGFVAKPKDFESLQRKYVQKAQGKEIRANIVKYDGHKKCVPGVMEEEDRTYKINSYGFRGEEVVSPKIVCMGASTTFGAYVTDNETYPYYLSEVLGVEVLNAGIVSMRISEIRRLLEAEIVDLKPDIIVVNSMFNNLVFSKFGRDTSSIMQRIHFAVINKSLFYCTFREKLRVLSGINITDIYLASAKDLANNFLNDTEFWETQEAEYDKIASLSNRLVVIKQPYTECKEWKLLSNDMKPVYDKYYKMLDKFETVTVDMPEVYFTDGLHLTKDGTRLLAEKVAEVINKEVK